MLLVQGDRCRARAPQPQQKCSNLKRRRPSRATGALVCRWKREIGSCLEAGNERLGVWASLETRLGLIGQGASTLTVRILLQVSEASGCLALQAYHASRQMDKRRSIQSSIRALASQVDGNIWPDDRAKDTTPVDMHSEPLPKEQINTHSAIQSIPTHAPHLNSYRVSPHSAPSQLTNKPLFIYHI